MTDSGASSPHEDRPTDPTASFYTHADKKSPMSRGSRGFLNRSIEKAYYRLPFFVDPAFLEAFLAFFLAEVFFPLALRYFGPT